MGDALPSDWAISEPKDYGRDLMVEIFEPRGDSKPLTMGLEFAVQLKATDKSRTPPRVAVGWRHINYWQSLAYPVMVVRYVAPRSALYGVWIHDQARWFNAASDAKTVALRFGEHDRLTPDRVARIAREVEAFRDVRHGRLDWPLRVSVRAPGIEDPLLVPRVLRAAMDLEHGLDQRIEFRVGEPPAGGACLTFEPDHLVLDLGGGVGTAIDAKSEEVLRSAAGPADLLALAVGPLSAIAADHAAALLLERALNTTAILSVESGLVAMRARRPDLALAVAQKLATVDPPMATVLIQVMTSTNAAESVYDGVEAVLRDLANQAEAEGRGDATYNLANWLTHHGRKEAGRDAYERLREIDPSYDALPYYWGEYAGVLFDLRAFARAADAYARAILLGDESANTRALYADALLHDGKYALAFEHFTLSAGYGDEAGRDSPYGLLGLAAAALARVNAGDQQQRDIARAEEIAERVRSGELPIDANSAELITGFDALNPTAWDIIKDRVLPHERIEPLVTLAFLVRHQVEPWTLLVVELYINLGPEHVLTRAAVSVADYFVGDALEASIHETLRSFLDVDDGEDGAAVAADVMSGIRNLVDEARSGDRGA